MLQNGTSALNQRTHVRAGSASCLAALEGLAGEHLGATKTVTVVTAMRITA